MIKNTFDISDFVPAQSLTGTVYELVKREKAARKAKKLTQKQLAERTGVSYGSIRRFEQTGEISLLSLVKLPTRSIALKISTTSSKSRPSPTSGT